MPVYEFCCPQCGLTASVLVRRVSNTEAPTCSRCGVRMQRAVSGFAFHKSLQSKVEQLDPKYDKMVDSASPDLASDNLIKRWGLDKPIPEDQKKVIKEKMETFED